MPAHEPSPPRLRVDPRHAPFLREFFSDHRSGRLGDLAEPYGTDEATLGRIRVHADTCGRIIEGIDRGEVVADAEVAVELRAVARATDEGNDYERAAREHEAFAHMLRQLGRPRGDERLRRALLLALVDPPAYGGFLPDLARRLGEPEADVEAAAAALEDGQLASVGEGYVAASPAAVALDALVRIAV